MRFSVLLLVNNSANPGCQLADLSFFVLSGMFYIPLSLILWL